MSKKYLLPITILFTVCFSFAITATAQEQSATYWPKVIPLKEMSITIYQPELERFSENSLEARSAFNIFDGKQLPVFGAIWFRARVHIDRANNSVFYDKIELIDVNFPDVTAAKKQEFRELLNAVTPTWQFNSSLDELAKAVRTVQATQASSLALKNNPPNIFYEQIETELVFIDGDPILEDIEGSGVHQYVVNTPYFIIHSSSDNYYYLQAGQYWYRTKNIYNEWQNIGAPPQRIQSLSQQSNQYNQQINNEITTNSSRRPQLIVVTHQAALIQTDGEPELVSLPDTHLMYVANTNNDLLKDMKTDEFFVRFSGRWYKSATLHRGNWQFVAPDSLPVYFRKIISDSHIGRVRISIPGTPEAMSAALDNAIPQTAIVDRKTAKLRVEYDGEPVFEPIESTTLQYAVNTESSVIKTNNNVYYAVDEAIWFTADSPTGIWYVATKVPAEVNDIPPGSPVFNIKFVYIYEYGPDLVYVGYTGGYTGSFLYQGCLFYGTGYRYKPWYKSKYYSRPLTFAFGVNSKPSKGNVRVTVGMGYGYGYPGYYSPYGYYGGGFGSYGYATWDGSNYELKKGYETKPVDPLNIYNNRVQGIIRTEQVRRNNPYEILPDNQQGPDGHWVPPTNLYADQSGDLYKEENGNWYKRNDGVWVKTKERPRN